MIFMNDSESQIKCLVQKDGYYSTVFLFNNWYMIVSQTLRIAIELAS